MIVCDCRPTTAPDCTTYLFKKQPAIVMFGKINAPYQCAVNRCMINHRLLDHYQIDTSKDLGIKDICPRPYDTVLIDSMGSCFACECTSWLPVSIGNLHRQDLDTILQSPVRRKMQQSVSDGTYRYCNNRQCTYLLANRVYNWHGEHALKEIRLATDNSCNLSCPSCRTKKIFIKSGKMLRMRHTLSDRVVQYLEHHRSPIKVHIGSDGDPFASLIYRRFMRISQHLPHLSYSIQTNGLLCKQMYPRVRSMFEKLRTLNVSIDGASQHTYESLRRGGSWQKIMDNLRFIKELKQVHQFEFKLHMVVQKSNWHEMLKMCELGDSVDADQVVLNRIEDWQTYNNFNEQKIPENNEVQRMLKQVDSHHLSQFWAKTNAT